MYDEYKNVLVTGGAGCIGMQVCKELARRGISVYLFDLPEQIARVNQYIDKDVKIFYGSILDQSSLRDAMINCDAVIHLAAYLGVKRTETNMLRCFEINVDGTKNVLECAIQNNIKKIIFASSSEVYGEPLENPITENSITQGKTIYAVSKLAGEELCRAYSQKYNHLSYTVLRYFNTYGPFQIAQFVISKFIKRISEGKSPIIYGDGQQKRSYCFSQDTSFATVEALLRSKTHGETINIGNSTQPITLEELAKTAIEVCGKTDDIKPFFEESFENTDRVQEREIFERFCDTTKAKELLDYTPQVHLREGIKIITESPSPSATWETTDANYMIDE